MKSCAHPEVLVTTQWAADRFHQSRFVERRRSQIVNQAAAVCRVSGPAVGAWRDYTHGRDHGIGSEDYSERAKGDDK